MYIHVYILSYQKGERSVNNCYVLSNISTVSVALGASEVLMTDELSVYNTGSHVEGDSFQQATKSLYHRKAALCPQKCQKKSKLIMKKTVELCFYTESHPNFLLKLFILFP